MMKVNWCKKSLLHVQIFFYYRGRKRWESRAQIINSFRDKFRLTDDELSDFSAQKCITELNKAYFTNNLLKISWCNSTMVHLQLFFYFCGMEKYVNDTKQIVLLFQDDFGYSIPNGVEVINELNKTLS